MRVADRLAGRLPAGAGLRNGLIRPRFIFTPHRQPQPTPVPVSLFDQFFFASASGSVTVTTTARPARRRRWAVPVSHHDRCFCQLKPASANTFQIVMIFKNLIRYR
jgi:hypothetical protein